MKKGILMLLVGMFFLGCTNRENRSSKSRSADVIIYGGTSAAVTAAVQLSIMNRSVIIVSPDIHLGGLTSSGLGFTDTGNKEVIGGLSREFYQRIYDYYQEPETWRWQQMEEYGNKGQGTPAIDGDQRTMWIFEPHIAEQVFEDFIHDFNIEIYRDEWLNREDGVTKVDGKIESITTLSGRTYEGEVFIDATYEGDLFSIDISDSPGYLYVVADLYYCLYLLLAIVLEGVYADNSWEAEQSDVIQMLGHVGGPLFQGRNILFS